MPISSQQYPSIAVPTVDAYMSTLVSREFLKRTHGNNVLVISLTGHTKDFYGASQALGISPDDAAQVSGIVIEGQKSQDIATHEGYALLDCDSLSEILGIFPAARVLCLNFVMLVPGSQSRGPIAERDLDLLIVNSNIIGQRTLVDATGTPAVHYGLSHILRLFARIEEMVIMRQAVALPEIADNVLGTIAQNGIVFNAPTIKKVVMQQVLAPTLFYATLQRPCTVSELTSLRLAVGLDHVNSIVSLITSARSLTDLALDISPAQSTSVFRSLSQYLLNNCPEQFVGPFQVCLRTKTMLQTFTISILAEVKVTDVINRTNSLSWACLEMFLRYTAPTVTTVTIELVHDFIRARCYLVHLLRAQNWQGVREEIKRKMEEEFLSTVSFSTCDLKQSGPMCLEISPEEEEIIRSRLGLSQERVKFPKSEIS